MPLLLIPEYSINKEQRIPERSKTAHRKPPVKCFLTLVFKSTHSTHPLSLCDEPRRAESLFLAQVSSAVLGDSSQWVSWQRDRETEKGIVRGRETERQRQRDRDTEKERDRDRETESERAGRKLRGGSCPSPSEFEEGFPLSPWLSLQGLLYDQRLSGVPSTDVPPTLGSARHTHGLG